MKKLNEKTIRISASSFSSFYRCSKMYEWQYIQRKPPDPGCITIYLVFGLALHKILEIHFKYGLSFEELLKSWKVLLYSTAIDTVGYEISKRERIEDFFKLGLEHIKNIPKMKQRWFEYDILNVEENFKFKYENEFFENVYLTGKIDLLLKHKVENLLVCLDWKSSKSKEKQIRKNKQLTFYSYFIKKSYNTSYDFICSALAYPYDSEILFTERTKDDVNELFNEINIMLERIKSEDFKKDPKISMALDDCYFCQYKKTCEKEK